MPGKTQAADADREIVKRLAQDIETAREIALDASGVSPDEHLHATCNLLRLRALISAALADARKQERERCAKVGDNEEGRGEDEMEGADLHDFLRAEGYALGSSRCAQFIRLLDAESGDSFAEG